MEPVHENFDLTRASNRRRDLIYSSDIKDFISENSHVIAVVKKLIQQLTNAVVEKRLTQRIIDQEALVLQDGNVCVTLKFIKKGPADIFKVDIDGKKYFVKKKTSSREGGVSEMDASIQAAKLVEGMKGVKIIDYKLGYSDTHGNNYFVSGWLDYPTLEEYFSKVDLRNPENNEVWKRYEEIIKKFTQFGDVADYNMLYDSVSDTIFLCDLHLNSQPYRDKYKD